MVKSFEWTGIPLHGPLVAPHYLLPLLLLVKSTCVKVGLQRAVIPNHGRQTTSSLGGNGHDNDEMLCVVPAKDPGGMVLSMNRRQKLGRGRCMVNLIGIRPRMTIVVFDMLRMSFYQPRYVAVVRSDEQLCTPS